MIPKISILVPIYNAARWLPAFVGALSRQRLDNAEFLFLDDCSTDDSMDVLERELNCGALMQSSRLLRHDVNRGVSEARQTLLEAATGEYIIFADPDDTMDDGMYSGLVDTAMQTNADLVWEDFFENDSRCKQSVPENTDVMLSSLLRGKLHGALWNKLMRRDFVTPSGARFLNGRVGLCEDLDFVCQVLCARPKVAYNDGCHYHYRTVTGSATHGLTEKSFASLQTVENHLTRILSADRFCEDLTYWRKGNRLAAFISKAVSDRFFYDYVDDLRDLSGLRTDLALKGLYWLAARRFRFISQRIYRLATLFKF